MSLRVAPTLPVALAPVYLCPSQGWMLVKQWEGIWHR